MNAQSHRFIFGLMLILLPVADLAASSPFGDFASKQSLTYTGRWTNTTFSSTDTYTCEIELDGYDFTGRVEIKGFVYGVGITVPLIYEGTLEEDGTTTLAETFPVYGDVSVTLDFTQSPAVLTGLSTPKIEEVPGIEPSTGDATFDFINFDSTFVVNFLGGGDPAVGVSNAALEVEEPTLISFSDPSTIEAGETVPLLVEASGSLISVQWYEGESGDTSNPIDGADDLAFESDPLHTDTQFWAQITNHVGDTLDTPTVDVTVNLPELIFMSGEDDPEGFHESAWLGWLNNVEAPWYYHYQHKYLYTSSSDESSIWFYDFELDWFWTNATTYPVMYQASTGHWLLYIHPSTEPRWFWDFGSLSYISIPE